MKHWMRHHYNTMNGMSPVNPSPSLRNQSHDTLARMTPIGICYIRKPSNRPTKCSICGEPTRKDELEIQMLAGRVQPTSGEYFHHFHPICFWKELAKIAMEAGDTVSKIDDLIGEIILDRIGGR